MNDEELLSAYLDGELDEARMAEVEARLEQDAVFAARFERLGAADDAVRAAFDPVLELPVPGRLIATARGTELPPPAANDNRRAFWLGGGAIAASLVAGLLFFAQPQGSGDDVQLALNAALESTPSGQTVEVPGQGRLTPQLSFASNDGGFCREFALADAGKSRVGLACRSGGKWSVEALVQGGRVQGEGYATAGEAQGTLDRIEQAKRAGDPLTAQEEAALIARNWASR